MHRAARSGLPCWTMLRMACSSPKACGPHDDVWDNVAGFLIHGKAGQPEALPAHDWCSGIHVHSEG